MSKEFFVACGLLLIGTIGFFSGAIYIWRQKLYYDQESKEVSTEIDIPLFGKLKTNAPAIAISFIGAVLAYFAYDLMKGRGPRLVNFQGEVAIDSNVTGINAVLVGVTSGSWQHTETFDGTRSFAVSIPVPNSWPTYSAYAFALGPTSAKPILIGTSLERPKFKVSIKP